MAGVEQYLEEEKRSPAEIQKEEAQDRFRQVFVYGGKDGRYVLTTLLNMLSFWDKSESEEQIYRRNAAVEILNIMGIGSFEDRAGLVDALCDHPVEIT